MISGDIRGEISGTKSGVKSGVKSIFTDDIRESLRLLFSLAGDLTAKGKRALIIVPDRMVVTVERELSLSLPASAQLYCDTVSFRRLANNVFRRFGGLCRNYAGRDAETLLMWRATSLLSGSLSVYGKTARDPSGAAAMLSAITELKQSMVTPEALLAAALRLEEDETFSSEKYKDIAKIYALYNELLTESFDDRQSELSAAASLLRENEFFTGEVFLYAFSGFTAQQYAMIREAARQAEQLTAIFVAPGGGARASAELEGIFDTESKLRAAASELRARYSREFVNMDRKTPISKLAASLWSAPALETDAEKAHGEGGDEDDGSVLIMECASRRAEVEAAAILTAEAIREGCRYRDIAICAGSTETYRGIIEEVFDEYAIPYHMSARVKIESEPAAAALLTALRIVTGGWQRHDIISYIKSGLTGIGADFPDTADELEIYMETWNIYGSRFHSPAGGNWSMNPDGYKSKRRREGDELLVRVNAARYAICAPLTKLADAFSRGRSADERAAAVLAHFDMLCENMPRMEGDGAERQIREQLRGMLERALTVVSLCSPHDAAPADYVAALRLALDTQSAATIPSRVDEVDISTSAGMRGAGFRRVIMLGCADGEFPADISDSHGGAGIFSDAERTALEGEGVVIGGRSRLMRSTELYNFSRCAASAYERLVFIYRRASSQPDVITRIRALLPGIKTVRFGGEASTEHIYTAGGAARALTRLSGARFDAVRKVLIGTGGYERLLRSLSLPITKADEMISERTAARLFGGDTSFSQSRLESFVLCGFGFYCDYVLGLREKKRASLGYADIGVFIHAVLERVFTAGLSPDMTDAETERMTDEIISDYIREVCPPEEADNARLRHLFRRLRRSVLIFVRAFRCEMTKSSFKPVLFEAGIGYTAAAPVEPVRIPLGDGSHAVMRGIADRIDSYRDGDGRLWIRVVDYKTGIKKFSPDDIDKGLNLQLPLYLYSICGSHDESLPLRLGGEYGDSVLPAGFLYLGVRPKDETKADYELDLSEDAEAEVSDERRLPRSGLLYADDAILRAMDPSLSGEFIPVRLKSDGTPTASARRMLVPDGGFDEIFGKMSRAVCKISLRMRSGEAQAKPLDYGGSSPCEYCAMRPVCRRRA